MSEPCASTFASRLSLKMFPPFMTMTIRLSASNRSTGVAVHGNQIRGHPGGEAAGPIRDSAPDGRLMCCGFDNLVIAEP